MKERLRPLKSRPERDLQSQGAGLPGEPYADKCPHHGTDHRWVEFSGRIRSQHGER
jgi:hypothetical protein